MLKSLQQELDFFKKHLPFVEIDDIVNSHFWQLPVLRNYFRTVLMDARAFQTSPVTASPANCTFAVHGIHALAPVGPAFGDQLPWFEALIRPHGHFNRWSPADFIDRLYLERPTLHTDLEVLRRVTGWLMARVERTRVSVNTHPESLTSRVFVDQVLDAQKAAMRQGHSICLELIEYGRCDEKLSLIDNARELQRAGILIALDDFGSRINCFDLCAAGIVDLLKIDLRLIDGLESDRNQRAIVDSILTLGRGLNAGVVAEGVETPEQVRVLKDMGVHYAQGFHYDKPQRLEI